MPTALRGHGMIRCMATQGSGHGTRQFRLEAPRGCRIDLSLGNWGMMSSCSNHHVCGTRSVWPRAAWIGGLAIVALGPLAGLPAERLPLTTSHVTGTPEPPPPYSTPRTFPKLQFHNPLEMVVNPGSDRWFVVEQHGKIFSFPDRQDCDHADLLLDIPAQIRSLPANGAVGDTYGLAFHPRFAENRYCYVCYVVNPKQG